MKNDVVLLDAEKFERLLEQEYGWEHKIGMVYYDEDAFSFYWDYRTEGETRSSVPDETLAWEEIGEYIGWDNVERCTDEHGNDCVLLWND